MPSNKALGIIEQLLATRNNIVQRLPLQQSRADNSFSQCSHARHAALLWSMSKAFCSAVGCYQIAPQVTVQRKMSSFTETASKDKEINLTFAC